MRRISIVLGSVLFSCSGLLWAQQGSSATQPAPILAGRAEHGLPGKAQGTERWIVQFATRSFDLQAFRTAIYTRRPAAEVAATDLRSSRASARRSIISANCTSGTVRSS